jgi:DNA processing protein
MIPGIGAVNGKKLIAYCGGAEAVFREKKSHLLKIPGVGRQLVEQILNNQALEEAEAELRFMEEEGIQAHYYLSKTYPRRLIHCEDGPLILYSKGEMDFNAGKVISIVGTRMATVKGKAFCEKLIEELKDHRPLIVSGLAYGIDITAHRAAMQQGLQTIGVLASGLDEIYPKSHANTARQMQGNGGIVSDYQSKTTLLPVQFAERNRIVAGMADAIIVIESSEKGGSLITAELGNGYNRDVFAVPGRVDDSQSRGCNRLIKQNKAALLESAADVEYIMGWEKQSPKSPKQAALFVDLSPEEQALVDTLKDRNTKGLDEISLEAGLPISKTTSLLLNLEFNGIVKSLPGKIYSLI